MTPLPRHYITSVLHSYRALGMQRRHSEVLTGESTLTDWMVSHDKGSQLQTSTKQLVAACS